MKFTSKIYYLVPPDLRFKAVSLKHSFTRFKRFHYSQNGEDIIVPKSFPRGYTGFYVDVGAHHPYRISNTYKLFRSGWHGINIDTNPDTIKLFKKARPRDINLSVGVSTAINTASQCVISALFLIYGSSSEYRHT